ncbi:MAG TPA: extracellular solute-binding protein [Clostridiales bacterium]|nr:extracellular solute-binding protein [Clostridiales bacterium]
MKTLLSKILSCVLTIFLIVSSVFISSCGASETSNALFPKADKRDYPQSMDIAFPGFFYRNNAYDAESGDKWLEDISTRYGVDLNVTTNANDASGIIKSLLTGGHTAEVVTGFAFMNTTNLVDMYANPQYILPLEDYLADNPVWLSLPQEVRDAFTVDGHIWAIPCSYYNLTPQLRIYDSEILDTLGIQAPTTLDEFADFTQQVSILQKSGGTDVTDIVPMCSYPYYCASDILRAYGVYTSGYGMIGYDPIEGCVTDGFLKPDAEEALEYLRNLYQKGVFNMTDYIGTSITSYRSALYAQENFATAYCSGYSSNMAYMGALSKYDCTTGMNRNGTVCPQVLDTSFSGYVLAANTAEPEKCVNFLLDLFFGSSYNYCETRYGSEKNYTINSDGTIDVNLTEDGLYPTIPNLLWRIDGLNMGDEYGGYNSSLYGDAASQYNTGVALSELRKNAIENGTAVEVPVVNQFAVRLSSWYTRDMYQNILLAASDCFVNAITDDTKTVKEVLNEYRTAMRGYGAQHLLDDANSIIGKTGVQTY